jgi:hypothetical protein
MVVLKLRMMETVVEAMVIMIGMDMDIEKAMVTVSDIEIMVKKTST